MRTVRRMSCGLLLLLTVAAMPGCKSCLGHAVVSSPNRFNPFAGKTSLPPAARQALGVDQQFRVKVGPPKATLAVSVIEPKDTAEPNGTAEPKGTVLVLHGIWLRAILMLHTGHMLANAGYRTVLVDLRGHGESTGDYLTFGRQEKIDLSQVIDELERRELIAGKLGMYGLSYGATTSIHLAGHDPRIQAVVAVAPFSRMRDAVNDFGRTLLPGVERALSDDHIQGSVDSGAQRAKFNPDTDNAVDSIKRTKAPVLIVHGTDDWLVPPYHARRLYEAGRDHTELRFIPETGHLDVWFDIHGDVAQHARQWFDRHLAGSAVGTVRVRD